MKNFVQPGQSIDVTATAEIKGGDVVVVQDMIGVAFNDAAVGQKLAISTVGVYELTKKTGAGKSFAAGKLVYFDVAGKACDVAAGSGIVKIGVAIEAATEAATTVKVRLNGSF